MSGLFGGSSSDTSAPTEVDTSSTPDMLGGYTGPSGSANQFNQNPAPSTDTSSGTNWGGILSTGIAGIGALSSLNKQNQANDLQRDQLDIERQKLPSQETKDVAEATYRQSREMMLYALQKFYEKKGWAMPTPGSSAPSSSSGPAPISPSKTRPVDDPLDGVNIGASGFSNATPSERAQAATGSAATPGAQQKSASNMNALFVRDPGDASKAIQNKMAKSSGSGSQIASLAQNPAIRQGTAYGVDQAGSALGAWKTGSEKATELYQGAYNSAIESGATEATAKAAGDEAASKAGSNVGQIVGTVAGGATAVNALTDKNKNAAQKGIGVAQGANQIYGANGGAGAGYVGAGLRGAQALANDKAPAKDRATRAQQEAGLAFGDAFTYGGASAVEALARRNKTTGPMLEKLDKFDQKTNPTTWALAGGIKAADNVFGGHKGGEQQQSDQYRKVMQDAGVLDKDWNLTLRDGQGNVTKYDIGRDGKGFQEAGGLDPNGFFEADGKTPSLQGRMTGRASALSDLITGSDPDQRDKFAGYFTRAGLEAAKGDDQAGREALRDLYGQFGYKDADQAVAGIQALLKAGKLDEQRAQAQINSIKDTFATSEGQRPNDAQRPERKEQEKSPKRERTDIRALLGQDDDEAKKAIQFKMGR